MSPRSFLKCLTLAIALPLAAAQAPLAGQQTTAAPQAANVAGGAQPSAAAGGGSCGLCLLVADVAGLVWYSQVFVNQATALVGVGANVTSTSILQNEGAFTYNPSNAAAPTGLTQINFAPSVTVGGAVLQSPTAYNVFTGYTITSAFRNNGACTTTTIVSKIQPAYSEILTQANGQVVLDSNGQRDFINYLGFSTCSNGGENIQFTALVQVSNSTTTSTTSFSGPIASQSLTITTPTTMMNASMPSAAIPAIVIGNNTITPTANPINLPTFNPSASQTVVSFPGPTSTIVPFLNAASIMKLPFASLAAWVVGLVGFGAGVYFM